MATPSSIISRNSVRKGGQPTHKSGSDDVALFSRFLDGDDRAFMELFHRHTPRLFVYCLKIVGDQESANDILQDVWERMARFRSQGKEPPKSPLGLLIRVTRNLCLNYKRDQRPNVSLEEIQEGKEPQVYHQTMTEMEEAVVVALDHLPDSERELLILHVYSGYSYEEIAEMYGESVGAIRTRAWRTRVKLGRLIAALMAMGDEEQESGTANDDSSNRQDDETMMFMNQSGKRTL